MGTLFDRLAEMSKRETIVSIAKARINRGETWLCPVRLEKGAEYTISASCDGRTPLTSALFNGCADPLCEAGTATDNHLSFVPRDGGDYLVRVVLEADSDQPKERKVTVTVRKAYIPSRVRAWFDPEKP